VTTPSNVLAHTVGGNGPPLLLLNGGLMTFAAWEPVAAPLMSSFRVIRCDFRGQLLSPGDPPPTLAGHADDLVALIEALGLGAVHVAGVSFGALVGVTLAARAPGRVHSLVAMNATDRITPEIAERGAPLRVAAREAAAGGDRGRVLDLVAETTWSAEYREANAAALAARRQVVELLPRTWFAALERLMASLEDLDLTPLLARIACPTLVVGGAADVTFPIAHTHALASGIRGARLVVVPRGSHGLVIERAPEIVDLVVNFVGGVEAQRALVAPGS
jgi:pimeloyl-ACP methyl ester carboxylesterase